MVFFLRSLFFFTRTIENYLPSPNKIATKIQIRKNIARVSRHFEGCLEALQDCEGASIPIQSLARAGLPGGKCMSDIPRIKCNTGRKGALNLSGIDWEVHGCSILWCKCAF